MKFTTMKLFKKILVMVAIAAAAALADDSEISSRKGLDDNELPTNTADFETVSNDLKVFEKLESLAERKSRCSPTISCTRAGGHCVKSKGKCNGVLDASGCKGHKKCKCCIPDLSTPVPTTCPDVTCPTTTTVTSPAITPCPTTTPMTCPTVTCPTAPPCPTTTTVTSPAITPCPTTTPMTCPNVTCPTATTVTCPTVTCPATTPCPTRATTTIPTTTEPPTTTPIPTTPIPTTTAPGCRKNFEDVNNQCLMFSSQRLNWIAARQDCGRNNSRLIVPKDFQVLVTYMKTNGITSQYWVGASDQPPATPLNYEWLDGKRNKVNSELWYNGYGPGQASVHRGQSCVKLHMGSKAELITAQDTNCDDPNDDYKYICEEY